ncbi:MAG TPA: flagellar basal body protein [Candidatus Angelobacter sp.]|nr:flagellar basal body protein [Candidatus Angelobacter sp.]
MSGIDTKRIELLEHFLDLATHRQGLIASNISNIDTPGFRTKDLDFKQEIQKILQTPENNPSPLAQEVKGLMERPDGNNVNLDREGLLLAQTQLQFHMGIQLIKEEFHRVQMAIEEGK